MRRDQRKHSYEGEDLPTKCSGCIYVEMSLHYEKTRVKSRVDKFS